MDTEQITRVLTNDRRAKAIFGGVFARDEFIRLTPDNDKSTRRTTKPRVYICNVDNSSQPGTHWLAIERHGDNVYYFDSFGLPPVLKEDLTEKITRMTNNRLFWNNVPLQEPSTNVCGYYCVIYCLLRSRHWTFDEIIDTLRGNNPHLLDKHQRDHVVSAFIHRQFKNVLPELSATNADIHNIEQFIR